ncbi:MAG: hypothetical protein GQ564_14825 [Bacteroidales bacterium]|nr:hypothetical protein [Bacteroidales bacterium]
MDNFDKFLSSKLNDDKIEFDIDNSSFNHLHYMVNLNSTKSEVKKNSMFSFLSDFLSPQFIAAKIAFVSILLIVMIGNNQNTRYSNINFQCDSTYIQNNTSFDTINTHIQYSDSLYR